MSLHRLFVAFRPPAETRRLLTGIMGGIPQARWQDDSQLHCTLRFIGDADRHQTADIAAALGSVRQDRLSLTLAQAGTFDRKGRVDALWIAVQPRADVAALHDRIGQSLRRVGIAPDDRAFMPHITIARFARGGAPGPEIAAAIPAPAGHSFEIRHFELLESHLGSEGAHYETLTRYPLG